MKVGLKQRQLAHDKTSKVPGSTSSRTNYSLLENINQTLTKSCKQYVKAYYTRTHTKKEKVKGK